MDEIDFISLFLAKSFGRSHIPIFKHALDVRNT